MTAPVCLASTPPNRSPRYCAEVPEPSLPLCRPCLDQASRAVPLLVHDFRDLEQMLPKPISAALDEYHVFQRRSGPPVEAPAPLQLHVEALQAEIWWLATTWAEVLCDRHRLADPPSHVRQGHAVQWAVQVLAPRVEVLARIGAVQLVSYPGADLDEATRFRGVEISYRTAAQGVLDLAHAHNRARTLLGLTEPVYVLPGRCQVRGCGAAELRVKDGSDTVWCDRCGAVMSRDDYDRLGNVFLREAAA